MDQKYTPDRVMQLQADEVFVFGSNDRGQHHGGAARDAVDHFGAIWGQARGLQGQSYAIVTLGPGVDLASIGAEVKELYSFARVHSELTFLMTKIGTGIAGLPAEPIIAMVNLDTPENVRLPRDWDMRG